MLKALNPGKWPIRRTLLADLRDAFSPAAGDAFDTCAAFVQRRAVHLPSRQQLVVMAGLLFLGMVAVGAARVTGQLVSRPARADHAEIVVGAWSRGIVSSMPRSSREPWGELVRENPVLVLQMCSVKLPPRGKANE